jgi:hypothetical protein
MNLQENIQRIKEMMGLLKEQEIPKCQSEIEALVPAAVKKWRDWLNNPATKEKFMKNHQIDEEKMNQIYKNYETVLSNIKVVAYDKNFKFTDFSEGVAQRLYQISRKKGLQGFVVQKFPNIIFYNCSIKMKEGPFHVVQHEISHLLDNIHPKTPSKMVSGLYDDQEIDKKLDKKKMEEFFVKVGITSPKEQRKIKRNYLNLFKLTDTVKEYGCQEGENLNGIQNLRDTLGKKPGEDITLQELKPYFILQDFEKMNTDIRKLVVCWVLKGLPDINTYLSELNTFAKNNPQQSSNAV